MTMPRYVDMSCATGSQVRGGAVSPLAGYEESHAWNVNFNNGNADNNNQNNEAFVLAVCSARASECQGAHVSLKELYDAWQMARRRKIPSYNQLDFESRWIDNLIELQRRINAGTWSPGPTTCFIAKRPKAREIHAPDFADRVVHHWLVPRIEELFEPGFIFDSYANRSGKGTHAAVRRLRMFVREVANGQGGGWYLQLDVKNFFNSIHRSTLYAMLKRRLQARHSPLTMMQATHALLRQSVQRQGVAYRSSAAERALVPAHKRLENAPAGCGLPIGNLSSQFFANVYLDRLDQFAKHTLHAQRYLRYVDDFVLVHRDRAQLEEWLAEITEFLRVKLRLELKADIKLRPLSAGIDFLGYVVYPTHTRVRRRVVRHALAALAATAKPRTREQREQRASVLASYLGHFAHANAHRLSKSLQESFRGR
jgi:retron-type reverse transcriptase